ncbi:13877_t:CDS:2 [Dentiscutata erythropus]|uniref:13877_t:CDS:1 n=1 Tax=Dentiscutata erythropus TaxID=1348616 RepID=A0A9N9CQT3_9GLOM|nr:13877_t:CDS:2 [Dentiscutata erythropus]
MINETKIDYITDRREKGFNSVYVKEEPENNARKSSRLQPNQYNVGQCREYCWLDLHGLHFEFLELVEDSW